MLGWATVGFICCSRRTLFAVAHHYSMKDVYMSEPPNRLTASDGAVLTYETVGSGPGCIVVPGTSAAATDYAELAALLAPSLTGVGENAPRIGRAFHLDHRAGPSRAESPASPP